MDRLGLVVDERDVDADPSLFEEFSIRVPVVLGPSGHVFAEGRIGPMAAAIAAFRVRFDAS